MANGVLQMGTSWFYSLFTRWTMNIADVHDSDLDGSTEQKEGIEGAETSSNDEPNILSVSVIDSDLDDSTKQTEWGEEAETSSLDYFEKPIVPVNDSDLDGSTEQKKGIEVIDSDLDESTKQTEGGEEAETSSHGFRKILRTRGDPQMTPSWVSKLAMMGFFDEEMHRRFEEMDRRFEDRIMGLEEVRALYGDEICWLSLRMQEYRNAEARRRFELNSLPKKLRRKLERMAEAKAGVNELMEKLEVLFELFLYVCLILETSTSKQTRRSKEDKCIVHILLLRSGVESNPGPRTWIDYLRGSDKPTNDDLMYLSGHIGNGWRHLGAKLRLRPAQLDHIEHDHKGMQNQIYHMLLETTKSELEASLKDILLMLDVASTEITMTVDWDDITLRFDNGQEQQMMQRDATDRMFARLADIENTIATLQAKQAEHEELKIKVTCLQAENKELKTEIASLKRGAEKRNAEEGETSTDVKRVKHQ